MLRFPSPLTKAISSAVRARRQTNTTAIPKLAPVPHYSQRKHIAWHVVVTGMKTYDTTRNNDYRTFNFWNISKVSGNVVPFAAIAFTQRTLSPAWNRAWWDQTTAAKGTSGNAEDTTTLEQIYGCYIGKRIKQSIIADSLQLKILDWLLVSENCGF